MLYVTSLLQARQEAAELEARAEGGRHYPAVQRGGHQPRQAAPQGLQFMMEMCEYLEGENLISDL